MVGLVYEYTNNNKHVHTLVNLEFSGQKYINYTLIIYYQEKIILVSCFYYRKELNNTVVIILVRIFFAKITLTAAILLASELCSHTTKENL